MSERTFNVQTPHQSGSDVKNWQDVINNQLRRWGADDLLTVDGDYGVATRSFSAKVLYGLGIKRAQMAKGVTPELRVKVRNRKLNVWEKARRAARARWRKGLHRGHVASPLGKVLADSWGWHPGIHDGLDLISLPAAPIHSMCNGQVVRADASGWWGLGARPSGGHPISDGDGIIIVRCSEDVGPFRRGMHVCYGHAEGAVVRAGEPVVAGQHLGHTGFAVAWHIHFMINNERAGANGFVRGVGDRDPRPFYDYARKNAA